MNAFPIYLTLFLLFLLQFVYFPIGVTHFETPKVYLAECLIFALVLWKLFSKSGFALTKLTKRWFIGLAGVLALGLVHVLFFATDLTFFGNAFRLQGVFLLWMLVAFAVLSNKIDIQKRLHTAFILTILVGQLVLTLLVDGGIAGRAIGSVGEPNALAAITLFVWPFIFFVNKPANVYIKVITAAIACLIIFLSGSRSGLIGFALQVLFIIPVVEFRFGIKRVFALCLALLLAAYTLPYFDQKSVYEKRSEIWQVAAAAGMEKPLLGHGFGNTEYALKEKATEMKTNLGLSYVDSSHNLFLDWWVQGGIVGVGLLVYLLVLTYMTCLKKKYMGRTVLLLGVLTALSFNPASIVSMIALWWLIGQGIVQKS